MRIYSRQERRLNVKFNIVGNIMDAQRQLMSGNIIEITVDKTKIFPGKEIFKLSDTYGFPVSDSCRLIMEKKMFVEWKGFVSAAIKAGWKNNKIYNTITEACIDSNYGKDYLYENFNIRKIKCVNKK